MATSKIGAVVCSGSNANGNWIKFEDGTMICTKSVPHSNLAINTPWGAVYESAMLSFGNWPETFISTPIVSTSISGNAAFLEVLSGTTGTRVGDAFLMRPSQGNITGAVNFTAIGRWK